jgi:outer membrane protein assembly factor BamB
MTLVGGSTPRGVCQRLVLFGVFAVALTGSTVAIEPEQFNEQSGLSGGIACVVGTENMETALGLADKGGFVVHLLDPEPAGVDLAKEQLATRGLLGREIYVDRLCGSRLPHADNLIDLVVARDESAVTKAEIMRVLAPARGIALVGTEVVTKPSLPGAGNWTHRMGSAANNPASTDTAFQMPAMIQYLAMPFHTSFHGTMLTEGGLRIEFSDWTTKKPDRNLLAGKLTARSQANGIVLWQRDLPLGIEPDWPVSALDSGRIYIGDGEANRILVIDGRAGEDLPPIAIAGEPGLRVRWLGIENGRLHALLGEAPQVRQPRSYIASRGYKDLRKEQGKAGKLLIAIDLDSRRELWRHEEPGFIDYRTVAVSGGRTYLYAINQRLACLDADGTLAWENKDAAWLKSLAQRRLMNLNYESASTLVVGPSGQLLLTVPWQGRDAMVFDSSTGTLLWKTRAGSPKNFFVGDKLHTGFVVYEAATGKEVERNRDLMSGSGCGIATWVPGLETGVAHVNFGFKSPCGVGSHAACGLLQIAPSQCDCGHHIHATTAFASAGDILTQVENQPQHPLETGPAQDTPLERNASTLTTQWPIYRGDARHWGYVAAPAPDKATVLWTAATLHPLPVPQGHDWHRMQWLERPTPPVTAGGMAFFATSEGAVHGIDLAKGKIAWTHWTSGPVLTAPAVADGRVYVGGCDGWVYCLDAANGQLAWRWRGAPGERTMPVCGKLMSTWPVIAVLPHDGTLYGVAGQWAHNGTVTFALDAATGQPRWTHWTKPHVYHVLEPFLSRDEPGFSPSGQLMVMNGKLYIRAYLGFPGVFDIDTGERIPEPIDLQEAQAHHSFRVKFTCGGQDFIAINDRLVLYGGGNFLLSNPDMRHEKRMSKFVAAKLNEDGMIKGLDNPIHAIPSSHIAPALDGKDILMVGGVGGRQFRGKYEPHGDTLGLSLWNVNGWMDHATRQARQAGPRRGLEDDDDPTAARRTQRAPNPYADFNSVVDALDMNEAAWRLHGLDINAVALTPNAAVVAHGVWEEGEMLRYSERYVEFAGWKLTAFARDTGSEMWSVDLPAEPIFNGIAPTGNGSWVVVLRDGSVACVGE